MEKILVLGASKNPARFSHKAIKILRAKHMTVLAIGHSSGMIADVLISTPPAGYHQSVHTIILYLSKENQTGYYQYILDLNPKQVIFNPGTENPELAEILLVNGIKAILDCAIVLINANRLGVH